jgi:hypothetical protein
VPAVVVNTNVVVAALLSGGGPSREVIRLMEELGKAALAVHDTETRFRLMASAGDRNAALDMLARLDEHDGQSPAASARL